MFSVVLESYTAGYDCASNAAELASIDAFELSISYDFSKGRNNPEGSQVLNLWWTEHLVYLSIFVSRRG